MGFHISALQIPSALKLYSFLENCKCRFKPIPTIPQECTKHCETRAYTHRASVHHRLDTHKPPREAQRLIISRPVLMFVGPRAPGCTYLLHKGDPTCRGTLNENLNAPSPPSSAGHCSGSLAGPNDSCLSMESTLRGVTRIREHLSIYIRPYFI
jgi:hypothetical protein